MVLPIIGFLAEEVTKFWPKEDCIIRGCAVHLLAGYREGCPHWTDLTRASRRSTRIPSAGDLVYYIFGIHEQADGLLSKRLNSKYSVEIRFYKNY